MIKTAIDKILAGEEDSILIPFDRKYDLILGE